MFAVRLSMLKAWIDLMTEVTTKRDGVLFTNNHVRGVCFGERLLKRKSDWLGNYAIEIHSTLIFHVINVFMGF